MHGRMNEGGSHAGQPLRQRALAKAVVGPGLQKQQPPSNANAPLLTAPAVASLGKLVSS